MDLPNVMACMVVVPWVWLITKFIVFANVCDVIPVIIFLSLLVLWNRAIQKDKLNMLKTMKDELKMKREAFSQTEGQQCEERCTQTVYETNNASTQVEKIQCLEKSTQAAVIQKDTFTQIEQKEFNTKSTETLSKIMQDKEVQTCFQVSENKESQTSSCLLSDKEVQTEIIPKIPSKVFVPFKKQKPKSTIPLTKEFLKYHQNKHTLQRRKIKFKPKLEKICEVNENENLPEFCKVPSYDELASPASSSEKTITTPNNCENTFLPEVDEDEKESDLDKLSSHEEFKLQASTIKKTIIAPNSVLQLGDSFNDGNHVIIQDESKCRKKEKKASFLKKKFTNLKKLFKK